MTTTSNFGEGCIYPDDDPIEWAKRYEIAIEPHPCANNCGKILHVTIPFACGRWRGLVSEPHDCGSEYDLAIATKATKKERQELMGYFSAVFEHFSNDEKE